MGELRAPILVIALVCSSAAGWAQGSSPDDQATIAILTQQIKELQTETGELREEVKALQSGHGGAAPSPVLVTPPPVPPSQTTQRQDVTEPSPGLIASLHESHGIQWQGFGELNYKVLDQRVPELGTNGFVPGSAGNFYTGDFDLFLSAKMNEKASVLSEIAFGEGDHQTFSVDLERFLLQYRFNDHFKVSLGRYQTGIGYYNTEFRSTSWLQTTADRPLIMEFADNGGLLPTQAVGVSISGLVPSGKAGLNYLFEYGSSDTVRPDINGSGNVDDENNGNHVCIGIFVRPDPLPGLQIGGSFYHDKVGDSSVQLRVRYGQTIVNAHVIYVARGFELLNEGVLIRHAAESSPQTFNMPAFYSQFSKRLGRVRPFFRYQYVNTNKKNTIYDDVGLRYGPSFGARYDFDDNIAFKAQLDHTVRGGLPNLNGLHLQVAFAF